MLYMEQMKRRHSSFPGEFIVWLGATTTTRKSKELAHWNGIALGTLEHKEKQFTWSLKCLLQTQIDLVQILALLRQAISSLSLALPIYVGRISASVTGSEISKISPAKMLHLELDNMVNALLANEY